MTPRYHYYLSTRKEPISSDHALWEKALPLDRGAFKGSNASPDSNSISYGAYFQAVTDFLSRNLITAPAHAGMPAALKVIHTGRVEAVSVFLIKHGAFYHPAKVEVTTSEGQHAFILNVAVSDPGRRCLGDEYHALSTLGEKLPFGFIPDVYIKGSGQCDSGDIFEMFLGQWIDEYFEFHLSSDPESHKNRLLVWGKNDNRFFLSAHQTLDVYRNASMILATCYNPVTTSRIHPWHHAAGDFIINPSEKNTRVKLITVRNYAPMLSGEQTGDALSETQVLEALLLFFLDLTIRMRLDRLDGVGETAWADDEVVAPGILGFFQGLDLSASVNGLPDNFPAFFRSYIKSFSADHLLDLAQDLVSGAYNKMSDETAVIMPNLFQHTRQLHQSV